MTFERAAEIIAAQYGLTLSDVRAKVWNDRSAERTSARIMICRVLPTFGCHDATVAKLLERCRSYPSVVRRKDPPIKVNLNFAEAA